MKTLNVRKLANAFMPNAQLSAVMPVAARVTTEAFQQAHGGLWVGGTVSVTESSGTTFAPNALNRLFHVGLQPIHVPAQDIRAVRRESGWLTGIIVVEHVHGELRFRCFGARGLAARMSAAFGVGATRQPQ